MSKLQPWELTPEEMDAALEVGAKTYLAAYEEAYQKHKAGETVLYPNEFHIKAGAIATAAAKKVADALEVHLEKPCDYTHLCTSMGDRTVTCVACKQDSFLVKLKQEVGLCGECDHDWETSLDGGEVHVCRKCGKSRYGSLE